MAVPNPYEARLDSFSEFAFSQSRAEGFRGRWLDHFKRRLQVDSRFLILEIGCSNGFFLSEVASQNPAQSFVGLDWKYKVIFKGAKNIDRLGLKNISLIRGRAQDLDKIFLEKELSEVWIFFPDPWAKKAQIKNRLLNASFFKVLHGLLDRGGRVYFKTDHPGYFQWVLAQFGISIDIDEGYNVDATAAASSKVINRTIRQKQVRRSEEGALPSTDPELLSRFNVTEFSKDYFLEKESFSSPAFKNNLTLFEKGFVREKLPIYYACFEKK